MGIQRALVAEGLPQEHSDWILQARLGFAPGFGKFHYEWNEPRLEMQKMLSVVDKLVTLMGGSEKPKCLTWDPTCRVTEPTDWKAGGLHEPEAVEAWQGLHEVSSWIVDWVRNGFYVEPDARVPHSNKRNAKELDPKSEKFDKEMFEFTAKKIRKDEKLGVVRRLGPVQNKKCKPDNVNRLSIAPKNSVEEPYRVCGDCREPVNSSYTNRKKVKFN